MTMNEFDGLMCVRQQALRVSRPRRVETAILAFTSSLTLLMEQEAKEKRTFNRSEILVLRGRGSYVNTCRELAQCGSHGNANIIYGGSLRYVYGRLFSSSSLLPKKREKSAPPLWFCEEDIGRCSALALNSGQRTVLLLELFLFLAVNGTCPKILKHDSCPSIIINPILATSDDESTSVAWSAVHRRWHVGVATIQIHFVVVRQNGRLDGLVFDQIRHPSVVDQEYFQWIDCRRSQHKYDWARTGRFTVLGTAVVAPFVHAWFSFLNRMIPGVSVAAVLKRVAVDQLTFSPCFMSIWLTSLWTLEGDLNDGIPGRLVESMPSLMVVNWGLWIPAQLINFRFVPVKFQVLYSNVVALVWNMYLSYSQTRKQFHVE
eukprot:scaffold15_cov204-Amphora_coffeaeformis.AAC.19